MAQDMLGPVVRALVTIPQELLGMVKDFVHKLSSGSESALWVEQAKLFLQHKPCWVEVVKEVKKVVKKTLTPLTAIRVGGTTTDQLIVGITTMPAEISNYAKSMFASEAFKISKETANVSLVALKIGDDLGFKEMPRTDQFMTPEFCAKWSAENLEDGWVIELCQPEDGPQLRKKWVNQPKGTVVWMAMERITDSVGSPVVWSVGRYSDGRLWLRARWANPDDLWNLDDCIVFRFRQVTQS